MKKLLRNALMLSAMAGTLFFTACDDEDEVAVDGPSLTLTSQLQDAYAEGSEVDLTYEFDAPGRIGQVMFDFIIDGTSVSDSTVTETQLGFTAEDTTGTFDFSFDVPEGTAGSDFVVEVTIIDRSNQRFVNDDAEFEVLEAINTYTTVLIGGFNNLSTGSFYDAISDSVYSTSNVRSSVANQGNIDFLYYFSNASQRTIASPDNTEAEATWAAQNPSNPAYPFTQVENSTRFTIAAQGTNFGFITTNAQLEAAFSEVGTETTRVTDLQEGSLVAFRVDNSRGSRYGVFQVTDVSGNSSGSITIDVKSQSEDNL